MFKAHLYNVTCRQCYWNITKNKNTITIKSLKLSKAYIYNIYDNYNDIYNFNVETILK